MLGQEGYVEVGHRTSLDAVGHDTVDGDVVFDLRDRADGLDPLVHSSLSRAVLWEGLAWVDANHATGDDDFSTLLSRVVLHVVPGEGGSIDRTLEVDVGAGCIRLGRHIVNGSIAAGKVVLGVAVDAPGIGNQDIYAVPFLPDSLEEGSLRLVRTDIAGDEDGRIARGIEGGYNGLAFLCAAADDGDSIAALVQMFR